MKRCITPSTAVKIHTRLVKKELGFPNSQLVDKVICLQAGRGRKSEVKFFSLCAELYKGTASRGWKKQKIGENMPILHLLLFPRITMRWQVLIIMIFICIAHNNDSRAVLATLSTLWELGFPNSFFICSQLFATLIVVCCASMTRQKWQMFVKNESIYPFGRMVFAPT